MILFFTMTLSEVYFYMILILYQLISLIIITNAEDLKEKKYFKKYFKITLLMGLTGILMELLNWSYLCKFNCSLITFIPFIILNISKSIIFIFKKIFKKEPFQVQRNELVDGIWIKNKGNLSEINYYKNFSFILILLPLLLILILFVLIKENFC